MKNTNTHNTSTAVFCIAVFFILFLSFTQATNAQTELVDAVRVSVSPTLPGPNQNVTVSIEGFSTDIDRATISWLLNGAVQKAGIGEKTFSFSTGSVGSKSTLRILIETVEGSLVEKTYSFSPAEVDLVWEADSYVPPFYRGKALAAPQASFRVVAIPHLSVGGTQVPAGQLIYTWERDGKVLGSLSGYGKNTIDVAGSLLGRAATVAVEVKTQSGGVAAKGRVTIPTTSPRVLLYEDQPLAGVLFNRAVGSAYTVSSDEITLAGYPFFFSVQTPADGGLAYTWRVGGREVAALMERPNTLTVRRGGVVSSASIALDVENRRELLQFARASAGLRYGETSEGLFR